MDMSMSKVQEIVKDKEAWCTAVHGIADSEIAEKLNNDSSSHQMSLSVHFPKINKNSTKSPGFSGF